VKDEANAKLVDSPIPSPRGDHRNAVQSAPIYVTSHILGTRFAADAIETSRRGQCPKYVRRAAFFAPDMDADTLHSELAETGLCRGRPSAKPSSAAPMMVLCEGPIRST
jgi:hypothetical protein